VREQDGVAGKVLDELAGREQLEGRATELLGSDAYNGPLKRHATRGLNRERSLGRASRNDA
jgi:hypothetical protein